MEKPKGDISERIADVKKGIDELEEQMCERAKPKLIVGTYLPIIEGESDVGEKRELLRTLLTIANTERIRERDVIDVIRSQSNDPILSVLMDEIVRSEE